MSNMKTDLNTVDLEIISDFSQFSDLRQEWNSLLERIDVHNPYLRHEWLASWWKAYGQDKKLWVIRFKNEGRTIGYVPLMKYKTKLTGIDIEAIGFLSNHWSRMDFILSDRQNDCMEKLAEFIKNEGLTVILAQVDQDSAYLPALKEALEVRQMKFTGTVKDNALLTLRGTWEGYLSKQSRNFRQSFRKKFRHLENFGHVVLISLKDDKDTIIKKIKAIAENSWQFQQNVNLIASREGWDFYQELIRADREQDFLDFSVLLVGGEPIAYMVGLKFNESYFAFDTAYHKEFHQYSPGMILHNLLLERLFKENFKKFDFGYVADYKKHWSQEISKMEDVTVFPHNTLGTVLGLSNRWKNVIKTRKEAKLKEIKK